MGIGLVTGRCWADPDLDVAVDALEALLPDRPHDAVVVALRHLDAVRGGGGGGGEPDRFAEGGLAFVRRLPDHLDLLRGFAGAATGPERHDLLGLAGGALLEHASKARGEDWVPKDRRGFLLLTEEADVLLQDAGYEAPGHVGIVHQRLVAGIGLGLPLSEMRYRYELTRAIRPTLYLGAINMFHMLCQKWYGSHALMFEFARERAREAPPGDPVTGLLARAYNEFWILEEDWDRVWPVMADGLDDLVAASDTLLAAHTTHPRTPEAHQAFAWLFGVMRVDADRTREHLLRGTDRVAELPWSYHGDAAEFYANALQDAGVVP